MYHFILDRRLSYKYVHMQIPPLHKMHNSSEKLKSYKKKLQFLILEWEHYNDLR